MAGTELHNSGIANVTIDRLQAAAVVAAENDQQPCSFCREIKTYSQQCIFHLPSFFALTKPAFRIPLVTVFAVQFSISMDYPRAHPYVRSSLDELTTDRRALWRHNSFHRQSKRWMNSASLFHAGIEIRKLTCLFP